MIFKTAWSLIKEAFAQWNASNVPRLGAALAYYSVFAIAPLLLLVITAGTWIFGADAARRNIYSELEGTFGEPVAQAIENVFVKNQESGGNTLATIIGVVVLIIGAAAVFGQLQEGLNEIWKVARKPNGGWVSYLRDRFVSITMVLGTAFLLLISLIISAVLHAIGAALSSSLPGGEALWKVVNAIVSFLVVTGLFALIYKCVPDARVAWRDVWVGALLTSALFGVGKFVLGWYLGQASTTSGYGAAGSLVVILLWVYYASQILLFGASFTRVYASWLGSGIKPSENAMRIDENKECRDIRQEAAREKAEQASVQAQH